MWSIDVGRHIQASLKYFYIWLKSQIIPLVLFLLLNNSNSVHFFTLSIFFSVVNSTLIIEYCPDNIQVNLATNESAIYVSWSNPYATDGTSNLTFSNSHDPGSLFPIGNTTVTYTFTDTAGNKATCRFNVTVKRTGNVWQLCTVK